MHMPTHLTYLCENLRGYTYVADWKVELADGAPHEVKDHSLEVS